MLKIAFATTDRQRVNQHFGTAEGLAIYDIDRHQAAFVGFGEFPPQDRDGQEGKLLAKIDFLEGCHAVFVQAIGASAIKQLLSRGVQPIRTQETERIDEIIIEIIEGIKVGGVPWIDRALSHVKDPDRFDQMASEEWHDLD